jgi:NADH-quinone oxidoreductase subunit N
MPPGFSSADLVYLLPELAVAAGAVVVLVLDLILRRPASPAADRPAWADQVIAGAALVTLAVAGGALVPSIGVNATAARGLIAVDAFAVFVDVLLLAAAVSTILMSGRYLAVERIHAGEYYFLVLCATLGMLVMAGGIDLVTIFVGLETMAVSFYLLAGFIRPNRRSNEAAVKYFVLGAFSLAILLYGMSFLYGLTGSTELRTIATALAGAERGRMLPLAVVLLVAGIGFKIAAVPFHMWAPDVYEGAPTPITAFLSVGSKVASFAMLIRIFVEGLPAFRVEGLGFISGLPYGWRDVFYVLSIVTMTLGNLSALAQTNTKRLLAYSSIAHAGYLLIGVVAGPPRGITAALVYFVAYALMQLGAFAVIVMLRRRDVIGDELKDFTGLAETHPAMAFAMLVFLLSLAGIPATAGFMGKLWLFGAALDAGYVWLAVIGVLNSALSLYYYARLVVLMWTPAAETVAQPPFQPSRALTAVVAVAIAGTIGLGLYPRFLFEVAASSAASLGVAPR